MDIRPDPSFKAWLSLDEKIVGKGLDKKLSKIGFDRSARVATVRVSLNTAVKITKQAGETKTGRFAKLGALAAVTGLIQTGKAIQKSLSSIAEKKTSSSFDFKNATATDTFTFFTKTEFSDPPLPTNADRKECFKFYSKNANQKKRDDLIKKLDTSAMFKNMFLRDMKKYLKESGDEDIPKNRKLFNDLVGSWKGATNLRYPNYEYPD